MEEKKVTTVLVGMSKAVGVFRSGSEKTAK